MEGPDREYARADPGTPISWLAAIQDGVWMLLVVLIPLSVNLWGQQPFELPKAALLRTLVWILVGLALAQGLLTRSREEPHRSAIPLLGPVVALGLAITVSTLLAADPALSLWGSYERAQGAVTNLSYLLLAVVAAHQMTETARARRAVTALTLGTVPMVVLALAQVLGWDPMGLVTDARSPVHATLGRANFVGAYLAIALPLTLVCATRTRARQARTAWIALLCTQTLVVALTQARGAWLASVVALGVFALLRWGPRLPRGWRAAAWVTVGAIAVVGPSGVLLSMARGGGSAAARLTIWRATVDLVRQRPLLGQGPDGLGLAFHRVYPPELVYYQGREVFVDRAHNLFLDWAVVAGLPGMLALLAVFVTFTVVASKALRGPMGLERRALIAAALAAVAGNTANNLVSFDVTATAGAVWMLIGMGTALASRQECAVAVGRFRPTAWRLALVAGMVASLGFAIVQVNARPVLADVAARTAVRAARRGDVARATSAAARAIRLWPFEPAYPLLVAEMAWRHAVAEDAAAFASLRRAEAALATAQSLRPSDPRVWLQTAGFYAASARRFGSPTQRLAGQAFRQAAALAPTRAAIHRAWGRWELQTGNLRLAADLLRRAVDLDATYGEAYLDLGTVSLLLQQDTEALDAYLAAVRWLPHSGDAYAGLAESYRRAGQPGEALRAVEEALRVDPDNRQAMDVLAVLENG